MSSLFPTPPPSIAGLALSMEFVSEQEEELLTQWIDQEPWDTTWDRRRQLYGTSYGRSSSPIPPIPEWGKRLIARLFSEGISERPFDQILVNEYQPGQGIALHRDYDPFDRTVASLSLLAPCLMDLRRVSDGHRETVWLPRRSLLVLQDEARYDWEHGIARRKRDRREGQWVPRQRRISVTFRMLRIIA